MPRWGVPLRPSRTLALLNQTMFGTNASRRPIRHARNGRLPTESKHRGQNASHHESKIGTPQYEWTRDPEHQVNAISIARNSRVRAPLAGQAAMSSGTVIAR
jgi:hypothetical protein